jgi:hypothetical protein
MAVSDVFMFVGLRIGRVCRAMIVARTRRGEGRGEERRVDVLLSRLGQSGRHLD